MFYLPDGIRPYPDHFVVEILNFFKHTYSKSETDVEKIVQSLDLKSVLQKKIGTLSKGTLKRFLLALSLLTPHPLLILDEPTNHINFRHIPVIAKALNEYQGTMIMISHMEEFVKEIKMDEFLELDKI
jgi:ATPase subunit of ABC transporter with duplicated ATPase domains